jgi:hypothetical protein
MFGRLFYAPNEREPLGESPNPTGGKPCDRRAAIARKAPPRRLSRGAQLRGFVQRGKARRRWARQPRALTRGRTAQRQEMHTTPGR